MSRLLLLLFLALSISAVGCGHVLYQRFDKSMWSNYIHSNELQLGMSKAEVVGTMGQPGIREEGDYQGGRYTIYFYLTHSMDFKDSNTVRGGYTPLIFKDNKLVGIGKRDYQAAVDQPGSVEFPTPYPGNR